MEQQLILGPPGTGKTTKCLNILEEEFSNGVRPDRILYSTFTRKGANEAIIRSCEKFKFKRDQLPLFRTLHSLAFQQLSISRDDVMQWRDYKRIGEILGLDFGYIDLEDGQMAPTGNKGDQMLYVLGLARAKMITPEEQFMDADFDWGMPEFDRFIRTLADYKKERGLVDFGDMIDMYIAAGQPLKIDVGIIDEAQDLSKQQWCMVNLAVANAERVYIAGDDDQAVFRWSGADVDSFLQLSGARIVLEHSYRLPRTIHAYANRISENISKRYPKAWSARDDDGSIAHVASIYDLEIKPGTNLFLARNKYLLKGFEEWLRSEGMPYTNARGSSIDKDCVMAIKAWELLRSGKTVDVGLVRLAYSFLKTGVGVTRGHKGLKGVTTDQCMKNLKQHHGLLTTDIWHEALTEMEDAEYYLALLRRGEKLDQPPRIHVSTIHGVKGGEADNVVLMTDMSWKTYLGYQENPDDEHRVFYVAVTRARHTLQVLYPQTKIYYEVP